RRASVSYRRRPRTPPHRPRTRRRRRPAAPARQARARGRSVRLPCARRRGGPPRPGGGPPDAARSASKGEFYPEAVRRSIRRADRAAVLLDDLLDDREPEAGASALGGKIRVEQPVLQSGGNPRSVVLYGHEDAVALAARLDRDRPALLPEGLDGVAEKVRHRAGEKAGVALHGQAWRGADRPAHARGGAVGGDGPL